VGESVPARVQGETRFLMAAWSAAAWHTGLAGAGGRARVDPALSGTYPALWCAAFHQSRKQLEQMCETTGVSVFAALALPPTRERPMGVLSMSADLDETTSAHLRPHTRPISLAQRRLVIKPGAAIQQVAPPSSGGGTIAASCAAH